MKKTKYAKGGRTIGGMSARLEYLTDAIGSDELYDKFRSKTGITSNDLKDIDAVAFAYTDYGGDFFDRVAIAYFNSNYPKNIVWETSAYNGANAIVFGDVAREYMTATENYPLGFEDLESAYYEAKDEAYYEMFENIIEELERDEWDFDKTSVYNYLNEAVGGRYNVLPSGQVDYNEREIIDELFDEGLIDKENFAKGGNMMDAEEESYSGLEKKAFWAGGNQGMRASMGKDYMTFEEWAEQNKIKPTKELRSAFIEGGKKALGMARGNYAKGGNMNTWTVKSHSGASGKYCLYNSYTGKSMGKFNSKESAVRFAKNMGSKAYAKGGLMGKLKSSASKIGKSVKSGYSKGKQYAKDKLHQKKKDIALDVIYETKENLAEGRDERMATEKAYNVVDRRYAKGGRVSVGNKVKIKDSGKTMRVNKISKNSDGYIEFSGSQGSYLKGDIDKMAKGGGVRSRRVSELLDEVTDYSDINKSDIPKIFNAETFEKGLDDDEIITKINKHLIHLGYTYDSKEYKWVKKMAKGGTTKTSRTDKQAYQRIKELIEPKGIWWVELWSSGNKGRLRVDYRKFNTKKEAEIFAKKIKQNFANKKTTDGVLYKYKRMWFEEKNDGFEDLRLKWKKLKEGYYAKGGTTKTSNNNARQYVEAMQPFEGSNLEGKMINGCYVVLSYGYYPIFVYKDGNWYENSNKYSNTTAKQMSRVRPYEDVNVIIKKTTEEMKKLYNKYAKGGKITEQIKSLKQGIADIDNEISNLWSDNSKGADRKREKLVAKRRQLWNKLYPLEKKLPKDQQGYLPLPTKLKKYREGRFAKGGAFKLKRGTTDLYMLKYISELANTYTKKLTQKQYQSLRNKLYDKGVSEGYFYDTDENYEKFDKKLGQALKVDWDSMAKGGKTEELKDRYVVEIRVHDDEGDYSEEDYEFDNKEEAFAFARRKGDVHEIYYYPKGRDSNPIHLWGNGGLIGGFNYSIGGL